MYNIKVTPNYYQNILGAPQEYLLRERDLPGGDQSDYSLVNWGLEEDAQEAIDILEDVSYSLSPGEAGRPNYEIIEAGDDVLS